MTESRTGSRRTAAVAALGAIAGAALALSLGAVASQAPGRPAGRPKPTPEQVDAETAQAMQVLNQFVGRWDVAGQSIDESGRTVANFSGSAHWTFVLAGNFLMGETILANGQAILDQVDYIGYSPGLRKYTHVMLTELDKSMVYQHGEWSPEAGAFVFSMAAPLDTPRGTPRSVGLEYAFDGTGIDATMTVQTGTKPMRTVRMRMTRSSSPDAPTGPGGFPTGEGQAQVRVRQGDQAAMQEEMRQAMAQVTSQRQAVQQRFNSTNAAWEAMFGSVRSAPGVAPATSARESMQGPD